MFAIFHKFASPKWFYSLSERILPGLALVSLILFTVGAVWGLVWSPPDYQQGDSVRIIYIHVPTAFLSMAVYVWIALAAAIGLVWRLKLAYVFAKCSAPVGAAFTFLALVTGSLWGKPMWGSWWEWDARLTSELILLFLYFGLIALQQAIDDQNSADRATGLLALVGVVNIPIIHYSVIWWNTLHQGPSISKMGAPSIDGSMLWPLLIMIVAFLFIAITNILMRMQNEILLRERHAAWVVEALDLKSNSF